MEQLPVDKIMKLQDIIVEEVNKYSEWQRGCRAAFPNCTFVGSKYQSQAVDWTSKSNEIAGDWKDGQGVVYKPGSLGREVLEEIV